MSSARQQLSLFIIFNYPGAAGASFERASSYLITCNVIVHPSYQLFYIRLSL